MLLADKKNNATLNALAICGINS